MYIRADVRSEQRSGYRKFRYMREKHDNSVREQFWFICMMAAPLRAFGSAACYRRDARMEANDS